MEAIASAEDSTRRRRPRIWHTDWLALRRLSAVVSELAQAIAKPGDIAIDLGCGDQPYRPIFQGQGVDYRGADFGAGSDYAISPDGICNAPGGIADLVLSFQVLEHVRNLDRYLGEARRLLNPEGQLILSTHGTWLFHPHPEDHRRWTRMGLIAELEDRGWQVDLCRSLVGPLAFTVLIRLTGFCFVLRKLPLLGPVLASVLATVMNARAVMEDRMTPAAIREDNACIYVIRARPA